MSKEFDTDELNSFLGEILGALKDLQNGYVRLTEESLKLNPPFSWNQNNPNKETLENFNKDMEQYRLLIRYSILAQDINRLDEWGILYPRSHNFDILALDKAAYLERFEQIKKQLLNINDERVTAAKEIIKCLDHLINNFR
jgi:hypothetical protein